VKELRLRCISNQEAANDYAAEFIENYNKRFAKTPLSDHDAHRPVREDEDLALIFTWQEDRKVSKNLTLHYKRDLYLIEPAPGAQRLRGKRCRVHEYADGNLKLREGGESFPFSVFEEKRRVTQGDIVSNKRLGAVLSKIQADQQNRDKEFLTKKKTLREKERVRRARARADAPTGNP
jgi:hypothetical protein